MKIAGLEIKVEKNVFYAFGVMVIIFAIIIGILGFISDDIQEMSLFGVLFVAVMSVSFHYLAQLIHLIGHAIAAWSTGYPKSGFWFLYIFAMSLYPRDEPILPARIHIQRSLGGVIGFTLVLVMVIILWTNTREAQWEIRYLTSFMLGEAILLFIVSAIFSDGVMFIRGKEWEKSAPENNISE